MTLSEQEIVRRKALQEMIDLGIDPFPAASFDVTHFSKDIKGGFPNQPDAYQDVKLAGRLMMIRIMGKASFAELQDSIGRIQLYISRDEICPGEDKTLYNTVFKKLIHLGDFVGIEGRVFTTKTGETTVHVTGFRLLSKSLKPLPVVKEKDGVSYDAVSDPEFRYRQRYADMVINPKVRETFIKRAKIIQSMRDYLNSRGYLEVETPVLQPIYGGAAARPFITHHNTLDMPLYLRIADELYLKRLIVGGFDAVYEISKDFRNEGMDRTHNPEFTMMEMYVAYKDYYWMMDTTEEMIEKILMDVHGTTEIDVYGKKVNFKRPWKRFTMFEAIEHFTGEKIDGLDEAGLRKVAAKLKVHLEDNMGAGKIIDEIFGECCEPNLIDPTFITDYPVEMSPLAKKHRDKEGLVERFEVICNGKELCNAFSELNDPVDQRKRFEEQIELGKRGDQEAMMLDEDFLRALEYGMPPTTGMGIGIDRLTMLLTNSPSIQDVIFFPQMRPEKKQKPASEEKS